MSGDAEAGSGGPHQGGRQHVVWQRAHGSMRGVGIRRGKPRRLVDWALQWYAWGSRLR
jgi:hypothetical protein